MLTFGGGWLEKELGENDDISDMIYHLMKIIIISKIDNYLPIILPAPFYISRGGSTKLSGHS